MPIVNKAKALILTTTLTTPLLTAGAAETIRITHIIASCGTTGGSITLSFFDSSSTVNAELWNARAITANNNLEMFDKFLENNDELRGGFTTATNAKMVIFYQIEA